VGVPHLGWSVLHCTALYSVQHSAQCREPDHPQDILLGDGPGRPPREEERPLSGLASSIVLLRLRNV
jgi:hypothetical protein